MNNLPSLRGFAKVMKTIVELLCLVHEQSLYIYNGKLNRSIIHVETSSTTYLSPENEKVPGHCFEVVQEK